MSARTSALVRLLAGLAISAVFLWLTLSQVDLEQVAAAIGGAAPAGLAAALLILTVDLFLRALRWRVLLLSVDGAVVRPSYRLTYGYLMLGFAANFVLPARLGDVARAVLAAGTFRAPRLAIFGTVMIERVSDGLTMLVLAIVSSLVVASASEMHDVTGYAVVLVGGGLIAAILGWVVISRSALATTRIATAITGIVRRLSAGAGAFRRVRSALSFVGLTAVLATTAILVAFAVLRSVGVNLSAIETVLFLSGIALSLAIPAAPGSIGTYELVGKTIIIGLGYTPEQGVAAILLMRIITTFPPALLGLVAAVLLHVRPDAIARSTAAPVGAGEGEGDVA
jgi:uncharacterized protein (TIRG00374 family)